MSGLSRPPAWLSACVMLGMTGCSPPKAQDHRAEAPAARESPPCSPEQLSCGLQKPAPSDGDTPFTNEDFQLSVVFPKGDPVCLTRSGDAPRGFFVQYADPPGCTERPHRPVRFVTLYGDWNASFEPTLAASASLGRPCTPPSPMARREIGDRPLSFPGRASIVCQFPADADGGIELTVYTAVGEQEGDGPGTRTPERVYFAAMGSTPEHLQADLQRFRRILATVRIEGADWRDPS